MRFFFITGNEIMHPIRKSRGLEWINNSRQMPCLTSFDQGALGYQQIVDDLKRRHRFFKWEDSRQILASALVALIQFNCGQIQPIYAANTERYNNRRGVIQYETNLLFRFYPVEDDISNGRKTNIRKTTFGQICAIFRDFYDLRITSVIPSSDQLRMYENCPDSKTTLFPAVIATQAAQNQIAQFEQENASDT